MPLPHKKTGSRPTNIFRNWCNYKSRVFSPTRMSCVRHTKLTTCRATYTKVVQEGLIGPKPWSVSNTCTICFIGTEPQHKTRFAPVSCEIWWVIWDSKWSREQASCTLENQNTIHHRAKVSLYKIIAQKEMMENSMVTFQKHLTFRQPLTTYPQNTPLMKKIPTWLQ